METFATAGRRVGDLIVVLEKGDEPRRRRGPSVGVPRRALLPGIPLSLIQKSPLRQRDEFLRRAEVVGVVRLAPAGERDHGRVMKVVVPQRVEAEAAARRRTAAASHVLRLVLRDQKNRSIAGRRRARPSRHLGQHMRRRGVEDLLRRIEAQTVEMKLVDPVRGVRDHELAHGRRVVVEVDRLAPFVLVAGGEIGGGELRRESCRPGRGGCRRRRE